MVSRRQILDGVWQQEFVDDVTLSSSIARLRKALGDDARNPRYIETLADGGYRLAAAVGFTEPSATVTPFPGPRSEPDRDPYPGLAAFTEADAALFFGREAEIATMWRRISRRRLLALIGPSGVGKSSFIRAGVMATAPARWRTLLCTPGEAPFMSLARALVPELAGDAEQVERLLAFDDPEVALAPVFKDLTLLGPPAAGDLPALSEKTMAKIQDPTSSSLDRAGIRFPTWTADVAEALAPLLETEGRGIYHCSSLEGSSKYEWARELADLAGFQNSFDVFQRVKLTIVVHLGSSNKIHDGWIFRDLLDEYFSDILMTLFSIVA